MQVIISARHFDVSDARRRLVEERFSRLDRFEERIGRVEVTLLEGKNRYEVEGDLSIERRGSVHAHAEAADFRTALDKVVAKLARQLKKSRSRYKNHNAVSKDRLDIPTEEPTA
jgi:ribosomal subunit interface protein